jgi:hypothetical protein
VDPGIPSEVTVVRELLELRSVFSGLDVEDSPAPYPRASL